VTATTTSEALAAVPPADALEMPAGTWGRGGDFQVWWNDHTVPFWREVDAAETRMEAFEARARSGALAPELFEALERQCLLLQSSDWPFLIDNEVSRDYAEKRIRTHVETFRRLAEMAESGHTDHEELVRIDDRDRLFREELRGRVSV
jgi:1,4-alpha-glucan branching enzyme